MSAGAALEWRVTAAGHSFVSRISICEGEKDWREASEGSMGFDEDERVTGSNADDKNARRL
jgi:hypothetical protein